MLTEIDGRLTTNIKATWYFQPPNHLEMLYAVSPVTTLQRTEKMP